MTKILLFFYYNKFNSSPFFTISASIKHRNQHYEENLIETKLHDQINTQVYVYTKVQWTLDIRKEVFFKFNIDSSAGLFR